MLARQPRPLCLPWRPSPRFAISLAAAAVLTIGAAAQAPNQPAAPAAASPAMNHQAAIHSAHHKRSAAKVEPAPEPPPAAPLPPPNALQQPAVPAVVTVGRDALSVRADNASLSQILHQIATQTGMRLDGVSGDERVFGSFGPGAPREVLTALLDGAGYNLVMVGDLPNGAPRELLLSRRTAGGGTQQANPQPQGNDNEEDNANDFEEAPSPPSIAPAEPPQGPGAVPPQGRTPQQIFLEQRQQQLQQQQQQSVPPPQ